MHLCGLIISSCHFIEQHALAMIWPNANKHNTTITLTCLVSIMQLWVWWYTLNKGKENDLHLGQSQSWHIPWCILMTMWRHTLCCRPWHWSSHRVHTARGVRERGRRVGGMQGRRGEGEEGRRHVQCEKVERYYVEEVIRSSRRGEEGEVWSTSCYLKKLQQLINDLRSKQGGISSLRKIESIRLCLTDEAY